MISVKKILMFIVIVLLFITPLLLEWFKDKKINVFKILKYGFSIGLTSYVSYAYKDFNYLLFGLIELYLIGIITNLVAYKYKRVAYGLNGIMLFLYNANMAVLLYGGTFLSLIMLSNLNSLQDLVGNAHIYILCVVLVVIFSFLPYKVGNIGKGKNVILIGIALVFEILTLSRNMGVYAPIYNLNLLVKDEINYIKLLSKIESMDISKETYYSSEIEDYVKKNKKLSKQPNVILIFTEGLSQNVIDDSRDIMANVRKYQNKSVSFDNYYNHTFATYRGIIGQLYSGYQFDNKDTNSLISLADIFNEEGYNTRFINVEPYNKLFTKYLESFGFDDVITDDSNVDGYAASLSDKTAFEYLFEHAMELNEKEEPFFLSMYTLGTHLSFDAIYNTFLDGRSNVLSRFYDLDIQFGEFMDKYKNSPLYNDTIVVFTTDHASYVDMDYLNAFDGYYTRDHAGVDEIPLFIYYKGVKKQVVDAKCRTTIDLAPTILDYLDISRENYFLGTSLFGDTSSMEQHVFYDGTNFAIIEDKLFYSLEDEEVINNIYSYIAVANKGKGK